MPASIPPHLGIICPDCHTDLDVIETRRSGTTQRRRRACPTCTFRITTYELTSTELDHINDHYIISLSDLAMQLDRLRHAVGRALSCDAPKPPRP